MPHSPTDKSHYRKRRGSASFDDDSVHKKSRPTTEDDSDDQSMLVDEDMGGYSEPGNPFIHFQIFIFKSSI